jgi:hypothetical protein
VVREPSTPRAPWLLRAGLALSVALMALGLTLRAASGETTAAVVSLRQLWAFDAPRGDWLMALGALVLGLTPGLRVVLLLAQWTRARDWRFALAAALVVVTLAVAMTLGAG